MALSERQKLLLSDRFFAMNINYHYFEYRHQRVMGPPKDVIFTSDRRCAEVFITKLPECINIRALFAVFGQCGQIYKLRIMRDFHSIVNNGLAYIAYFSEDSAARAIQHLNHYRIIPGHTITVEKSFDNRRLYIGGIPPFKIRDEIWKELEGQGMKGIVDVITYRSYGNPAHTRGFAFIEFESHTLAALTLFKFQKMLLFRVPVTIEWSIPLAEVPDETMQNSCKLFLRNLQIKWTAQQIQSLVNHLVHPRRVLKVYKFKDYAFVHFLSRVDAEYARSLLRVHFSGSPVEIEWGKPRSRVTTPTFRNKQISKLIAKRRSQPQPQRPIRSTSANSSGSLPVNGVHGISAAMSSLSLNETTSSSGVNNN